MLSVYSSTWLGTDLSVSILVLHTQRFMFNYHLLTASVISIRDPAFHERAEVVTISSIPLFFAIAVEITLLNLVFVTTWLLKDPSPSQHQWQIQYVNLFFEMGVCPCFYFLGWLPTHDSPALASGMISVSPHTAIHVLNTCLPCVRKGQTNILPDLF